MAENTTSNKDRLKEITDGIEQGIQELFTSEKYMQYLRTMSRFHKYSVNNTMLIYMQRPDATLVAGFNKWRDQFGRNVMKGEKSIKIIAPTPFKKMIEQDKVDPQTKKPVLNPDGTVATEEVEIRIPLYKVVSVFDVAQTDGKPLPTLSENLSGDVRQYEIFMEALRRSAPVPIVFEKIAPDTDGYFSEDDQRIAIREGMSEVQPVSATVHEIAHSKLHNRELERLAAEAMDIKKDPPKPKDRHTEEVEAESVSYAVCAYYGIQTGENSFGYIASWSKDKELSELRASLETINKTSSGLISDIDRNFAEIVKERGIDMTAPEQTAEQPLPEAAPLTEPEQPAPEIQPSDEPTLGGGKIVDVKIETNNPNAPAPELEQDYPMPDPALTVEDMHNYGYLDGDMLPLTKERAIELQEQDLTVYMLFEGNGAGMAFDQEDIDSHNGMFAVTREEWDEVRDKLAPMEDRAVSYQQGGATRQQMREQIDFVAAWEQKNSVPPAQRLTQWYGDYHLYEPTGGTSAVQISEKYNHLKNAEMAMEDDYGMIDGIINNGPKQPTVAELGAQVKAGQTISLLDLAHAVKDERRKERPSVVEQLKNQPIQREHSKTAPKKSAERELWATFLRCMARTQSLPPKSSISA